MDDVIHASDCALHNEPAMPAGPCDCGAIQPIIPQAWEDVADDVTGAIEKAVQPLLKKVVDDLYGGLLDATQDYLRENLAFNIASRISTAEREAASARQENDRLRELVEGLLHQFEHKGCTCTFPNPDCCSYSAASFAMQRAWGGAA